MLHEPVSKNMKWILALGALALVGLIYSTFLDAGRELDLMQTQPTLTTKKVAVPTNAPTPSITPIPSTGQR